MKKSVIRIIVAAATVIFLSNCRKDETTFDAYFYANWSAIDAPLTLYIDDENKGDLQYFSVRLTCENDTLKQKALHLVLKSGKFKIVAKDKKGVIKSSGTVTLKKNSTSVSGTMGGQDVSVAGKCAIIGIKE